MVDYPNLQGDMPRPPGDGYREGGLQQYNTTFRYHSGGLAGFTLQSIIGLASSLYPETGDLPNAGVNLGLRRPDWTQATYVKYATGQRGRPNFVNLIPAGSYAMNARLRISGGYPWNGSLRFKGTLHLSLGWPN